MSEGKGAGGKVGKWAGGKVGKRMNSEMTKTEMLVRRKAQYMAEWRAKNKEHEQAYRKANRERTQQQLKAWRAANPEKYQAQGSRAYKKALAKYGREEFNRRQRAQQRKHWPRILASSRVRAKAKRAADPVAQRAKDAEYRQRARVQIRQWGRDKAAEVTPGYVRKLLCNGSKLRGVNWPEPLVQAYAANIKLKRQLKSWQNQETSTN